jgi:hypothetical protein
MEECAATTTRLSNLEVLQRHQPQQATEGKCWSSWRSLQESQEVRIRTGLGVRINNERSWRSQREDSTGQPRIATTATQPRATRRQPPHQANEPIHVQVQSRTAPITTTKEATKRKCNELVQQPPQQNEENHAIKGTPGSCQKELLQPPQPTLGSTRNQPSRGMEEKGKQTEGCQRESNGRKSLRNQLSKRREGN